MQEIVVPEAKRDVYDCRYVDHEQHHVSNVELPNPFRQPSCANYKAWSRIIRPSTSAAV
jgi:hypothetical protein